MEILQIIWPSKDLSGTTRYPDLGKIPTFSRFFLQRPLCGSCISHCSSDGDDGVVGDGRVA